MAPTGSCPGELLAGATEQPLAAVVTGIGDDVAEQQLERVTERRSGLEAQVDEIRAVDGEIGQPVRARALRFERLPECFELVEARLRHSPLSQDVGALEP